MQQKILKILFNFMYSGDTMLAMKLACAQLSLYTPLYKM